MASRNFEFDTTITVNDEEIEVTVEGSYTPGYAGRWYAPNGDPGDPPEPAEVEVESITDSDGKTYDYDSLSDGEKERLDEKAQNEAESDIDGDEPGYEPDVD